MAARPTETKDACRAGAASAPLHNVDMYDCSYCDSPLRRIEIRSPANKNDRRWENVSLLAVFFSNFTHRCGVLFSIAYGTSPPLRGTSPERGGKRVTSYARQPWLPFQGSWLDASVETERFPFRGAGTAAGGTDEVPIPPRKREEPFCIKQ